MEYIASPAARHPFALSCAEIFMGFNPNIRGVRATKMKNDYTYDILMQLANFLYKIDAIRWNTAEPFFDLTSLDMFDAFCDRLRK